MAIDWPPMGTFVTIGFGAGIGTFAAPAAGPCIRSALAACVRRTWRSAARAPGLPLARAVGIGRRYPDWPLWWAVVTGNGLAFVNRIGGGIRPFWAVPRFAAVFAVF